MATLAILRLVCGKRTSNCTSTTSERLVVFINLIYDFSALRNSIEITWDDTTCVVVAYQRIRVYLLSRHHHTFVHRHSCTPICHLNKANPWQLDAPVQNSWLIEFKRYVVTPSSTFPIDLCVICGFWLYRYVDHWQTRLSNNCWKWNDVFPGSLDTYKA